MRKNFLQQLMFAVSDKSPQSRFDLVFREIPGLAKSKKTYIRERITRTSNFGENPLPDVRTKEPLHQKRLRFWPSPQDYNEAIQNLSSCLIEPELSGAQAELTSLGLPKVITGAFASVYRVNVPSGEWALRCFLHNRTDQHERYRLISEHLDRLSLAYTVPFEYKEDGLKIAGQSYPLLRMEWVQGVPLNEYVAANLNNPELLSDLAREWKGLACWLTDHQVAHGDLQHGNILVYNGRIKLVDYDGIYVPSLAGRDSLELGHRNYQHPARAPHHFDLWLDHFPSWVIFTSIYCLSLDGTLCKKLGLSVDDECLLFKYSDFADPLHSQTFFILENHSSSEIRLAARQLRALLRMPISDVPSLIENGQLIDDSLMLDLPVLEKPFEKPSKPQSHQTFSSPTRDAGDRNHRRRSNISSSRSVRIPKWNMRFPVKTGSQWKFYFDVLVWSSKGIFLAISILTITFLICLMLGTAVFRSDDLQYLLHSMNAKTKQPDHSEEAVMITTESQFYDIKRSGDEAWSQGLYMQASDAYRRAFDFATRNNLPSHDKGDVLYLLADCLKNMEDAESTSVLDNAIAEYLKDGSIDDQVIDATDYLASLYRASDRSKLSGVNKYIAKALSTSGLSHAEKARLLWIKEENDRFLSSPSFKGSQAKELSSDQTTLLKNAYEGLARGKFRVAEKAFQKLVDETKTYPKPDAGRADLLVGLSQCQLAINPNKLTNQTKTHLFDALANYKVTGVVNVKTVIACSLLTNAYRRGAVSKADTNGYLQTLTEYLDEFKILRENEGAPSADLDGLIGKNKSLE